MYVRIRYIPDNILGFAVGRRDTIGSGTEYLVRLDNGKKFWTDEQNVKFI